MLVSNIIRNTGLCLRSVEFLQKEPASSSPCLLPGMESILPVFGISKGFVRSYHLISPVLALGSLVNVFPFIISCIEIPVSKQYRP